MNNQLVPAIASVSWNRILTEKELESYKKCCIKLPKKDIVKKILSFIENNNVTQEDKKVFNKILGDTKILNKLQICTDGSYVNGRIFFKNFYNNNTTNIWVDGKYWNQHYKKHKSNLDTMSKLNYMKYNFEVIFLHLVSDSKAWEDKLDSEQWEDEYDDWC